MIELAAIKGTIGSLKIASDIVKGFVGLKTAAEINAKVIELQNIILSAQGDALAAQSDQFSMAEEIRNLKQEAMRLKEWGTQKARYKLVAPWEGATMYALKESMKESDPPHWICTNCYENGVKSILQYQRAATGFASYVCTNCGFIVHGHFRGACPVDYAKD